MINRQRFHVHEIFYVILIMSSSPSLIFHSPISKVSYKSGNIIFNLPNFVTPILFPTTRGEFSRLKDRYSRCIEKNHLLVWRWSGNSLLELPTHQNSIMECTVCVEHTAYRCVNCKKQYYCSIACLERDEPKHSLVCGKVKFE